MWVKVKLKGDEQRRGLRSRKTLAMLYFFTKINLVSSWEESSIYLKSVTELTLQERYPTRESKYEDGKKKKTPQMQYLIVLVNK